MVATTMRTYTVSYERDERGWWVASVLELRGCRTQGRTIAQARSRIREALGLFVDNSERAALVERVKLAADARRALARLEAARQRAAKEQQHAQASTRDAVRVLTGKLRLSVRDAGELLGLSHQRVQQLARRRAG